MTRNKERRSRSAQPGENHQGGVVRLVAYLSLPFRHEYSHENKDEDTEDGRPRDKLDEEFEIAFSDDTANPA